MFVCPKVSKNLTDNISKNVAKIVVSVLAAGTLGAAVASEVPTTNDSVFMNDSVTVAQHQPLLMRPAATLTNGPAWHSSHYSHSSHRSHFSHYSSRY